LYAYIQSFVSYLGGFRLCKLNNSKQALPHRKLLAHNTVRAVERVRHFQVERKNCKIDLVSAITFEINVAEQSVDSLL